MTIKTSKYKPVPNLNLSNATQVSPNSGTHNFIVIN